ncbi:MAG: excalibur calcium-binding domain-containing protein [Alphaproteobacteria bacterium]|nr:excalibur calcium-binding domain-containing protein [Alphaproteobacteria bacterium]
MRHLFAAFAIIGIAVLPASATEPGFSPARPGIAPLDAVSIVAQSWSCNPRKTCGKIGSCDEAYWYYINCSWGGRLDGDGDGVPCESIC